ncbi:MAG: ABC transporter permease [Acidobacteria bacterium]|nr:ABC transporter permease [Acidobacteriota bacterium]
MNWIWAELRQMTRRLGRAPMFTGITLLTLAIGIGANTAIFTVVNRVLLQPLPLKDSDRLVAVWQTAPGIGIADLNASPSTYFLYREEGRVFEDIGLWRDEAMSVTGLAEPERVPVLVVTERVLPLLRVEPAIGRTFSASDDQPDAALTVMLTHGYWQRKFGGDPGIVGKTLWMDGRSREVIGVLPASFQFMNLQPSAVRPFQFNRGAAMVGNFSFQAVARLKPGVTLADANADVARMLQILPQKFRMAPGISLEMMKQARFGPNVRMLKNDVIGDIGNVLWALMATIGIVLLIACANVANLLLVRVEGRHRELAVRAALGAGRGQIARELLLESGLLGMVGGAAGLAFAYGVLELLQWLSPPYLPRLNEIRLDSLAVLYTMGLSMLAGFGFGLIPVLKWRGSDLESALRGGGRSMSEGRERHRTRSALVIVQVAMALVLLVSAGLMIRTLGALRQVDPGFRNPEQLMSIRISIPNALVPEPEKVTQQAEAITRRLEAIPGVERVAMSSSIPMGGGSGNDPIFAEGKAYQPGQMPPLRRWKYLVPGYFGTMGARLLAGRDFTWADIHEMRPVGVVSDGMAKETWGSAEAAIGKRIRENLNGRWREVVGVVSDERDNGVDKPAPAIVYWPMAMRNVWGYDVNIQRSMAVVVRSSRAGTAALLGEIRQAVWAVNPNLPIANPRTVKEIYDRSMGRTSFTLILLSLAAGMALLLGVVGIYGVISYSVSQRTREIGIRLALGAPAGNVQGLFLRHALTLAAIGGVCGVAAAMAVSRLLTALLFGVTPGDPLTYGSVATLLTACAGLAAYVPARRATGVDPVSALRAE